MTKDYPGEKWKTVTFDFEFTNDFRIEISSYGRLRTFNKELKKEFQPGVINYFKEFAGVEGSKIHEDLKLRELIYYRFAFQKYK